MTEAEYKKLMREAKREFNEWLADSRRARALIKKEASKIRKATLSKRNK